MKQEANQIVADHSRLERLFLHYFDIHFLQDKGRISATQKFRNEIRLATRLAVASADRVLVPAASYFESALCRQTIDELGDLVRHGVIMLVGSAPNLEEFAREHRDEHYYRRGSAQHKSYSIDLNLDSLPAYQRRHSSATKDIVDRWGLKINTEEIPRLLRDAIGRCDSQLEARLESVPNQLCGLAFVPEHVYEIIGLSADAHVARLRITSVINEAYFHSYVRELDAGVIVDMSYLASDFKMPSYGRNLSYVRMIRFLMSVDRLNVFSECAPETLVSMGNHPNWRRAVQDSVTYAQPRPPAEPRGIAFTPPVSALPVVSAGSADSTHSVLCVAAASIEFTAVRRRLDEEFGVGQIVPLVDDMTDFAVEYHDSSTSVRWSLATLAFQAQLEAASRLPKLITQLNPTLILMVGMCMGIPKRGYAKGTVIIPNEVFSLDHRRLTKDQDYTRPHGERVTSGLYMLARLIKTDDLAYKVVADKGLASASTKIENPEAHLVDLIEERFPDVAAFDMEGGGFYRASDGRQCLWIKAVADCGESQAQTNADQDAKHAVQSDVTVNAVDFAIRLIRQFVESGSRSPRT